MNCKVMGIVNVTPDSFSDGGQYFRPEEAIRRARNLMEDGADIIDLGGESTRPGAVPLAWEEEWSRLEPVLTGLLRGTDPIQRGSVPLSVDTYHPETAERALKAGAKIINCVDADPIPEMLKICAKYGAELVLPSSLMGTDPVSQRGPVPSQRGSVPGVGVGSVPVIWDPMIGFGTSREEDLELLRSLPELAKKGRVLIGASRKRIVKKLTGEKVTGKNLGGNVGIAVWCALNGASIVRVHDVKETVQALKVVAALSA